MTTARALCTNHRTAWPSAEMADALGFDWTRSLVYNLDEWMAQVDALDRARIKHVALMHSENDAINHTFQPGVWAAVAQDWVNRHGGRIKAVEVLNEWDLLGIHPKVAAAVIQAVAPIFRNAGILVLAGSVAGGSWPAALQELFYELPPGSVDGACFHPYGKHGRRFYRTQRPDFGTIYDAVVAAHEIANAPIWLTESGVQLDDVLEPYDPTGEQGQKEWVEAAINDCDDLGNDICPLWSFFSYSDSMNSPNEHGLQAFGLFDDEWKPRPAAFTYAAIADGTGDFSFLGANQEEPEPQPQPVFTLGFEKWARLQPELIGQPLANEHGAGEGWTTQPTSTGRLQWVDSKGHAFVDHTGRLFRWQESLSESVEITP